MYRDAGQPCPRCGDNLIDANAARSCPSCKGLWLGMGDLRAMAQNMTLDYELPFESDVRQALACPECREPMAPFTLFAVEIDRCDRHGVWFDPDELAQVLMAVWVTSRPT